MRGARLLFLLPCLAPLAGVAADYRSVAVDAAILYDAPSAQARKVAVLSRHYPVELVVTLEKWAKVRDATGGLAWIELKNVVEGRMVLVTVPLADVRQAPNKNSALLFQAEKDTALELIEFAAGGWVKVRHRDGDAGFVEIGQLWGA